tara:strand:+ start:371 stop:640 length:270 start_codon:yes stop_codon:yes gene_type:complete
MRATTKAWLLNIISMGIGAIVLLFSLVASYAIMQESIEMLKTMPMDTSIFIGASLGTGLILLWLNSLLIDSVAWTVATYWRTAEGEKNE